MMSEQSDTLVDVARELWDSAGRWEGGARIVGNVRASDVERLCEAAVLTWDPHPTMRMAEDPCGSGPGAARERKVESVSESPRLPIDFDELSDRIEQSISDGVKSFGPETVLCLMAKVHELRGDVEIRRDEADSERLKRRQAEEWLSAIKEMLRPWWHSARPNWDGLPNPWLPGETAGVADEIRKREEAAGCLLRATKQLLDAFENGRIKDLHWWQAYRAIDQATSSGIVAPEELP